MYCEYMQHQKLVLTYWRITMSSGVGPDRVGPNFYSYWIGQSIFGLDRSISSVYSYRIQIIEPIKQLWKCT